MIFDYRTQYHEYRRYIELLKRKVGTPVAQASLAVVGTLLLTALLIVAAIRPTIVTIVELVRDLQTEETIVEQLDRKIRSLQIAQQRLEAIEEKLPAAIIAIPIQIDLIGFTKRLELLASEHHMVVFEIAHEKLQLKRAKDSQVSLKTFPVYAIPVRVTLGGEEESIRGYIEDVERLDRLTSLTKSILTSVPLEDRKERPFPVYSTLYLDFFTTTPVRLEEPAKNSRLPGDVRKERQ